MFRSALVVAVAALSAVASAQNYSTSGNLSIDTSQIDPSLLQTWCNAQTTACPLICGGDAFPNTCDSSTLQYTCTCTDGSSPNISDYSQTVPFFICEQWKANCVDNHPNDLDGITACNSVVCGMKNASSVAGASSSSSSSMPTSTSASPSGSNAASATTSGANSASATHSGSASMAIAQNYGTGIVFSALLALFGLAL